MPDQIVINGNGSSHKVRAAPPTPLTRKSCPILKVSKVPDMDILLINHSDPPVLGAGRPSTATTAAAVTNATFYLISIRHREIPFTHEQVNGAMQNKLCPTELQHND